MVEFISPYAWKGMRSLGSVEIDSQLEMLFMSAFFYTSLQSGTNCNVLSLIVVLLKVLLDVFYHYFTAARSAISNRTTTCSSGKVLRLKVMIGRTT